MSIRKAISLPWQPVGRRFSRFRGGVLSHSLSILRLSRFSHARVFRMSRKTPYNYPFSRFRPQASELSLASPPAFSVRTPAGPYSIRSAFRNHDSILSFTDSFHWFRASEMFISVRCSIMIDSSGAPFDLRTSYEQGPSLPTLHYQDAPQDFL